MGSRGAFIRVGLLLVGTLALLVGAVFVLTSEGWSPGHHYETYFRESVQGLDVGAPVKYGGVSVGSVTSIGLVAAEYGASGRETMTNPVFHMVVVRFKMNPARLGPMPGTAQAVAHGLRARLASQGLTGVMYLAIDFLPPDRYPAEPVPWVPRYDYIPSVPSTIAEVQDMGTALLEKLNAIDFAGIARDVQGLIGELHASVREGDLHQLITDLRRATGTMQSELDRADLPGLTAQLRAAAAGVQGLAQGRDTRRLLRDADDALRRLPPAIAALQQTAARAGNATSDLDAQLAPLLADARAAVDNFRDLGDSLRQNPGALLWQRPPPHPRGGAGGGGGGAGGP
jgi:ABC-type transporter Mla subunit MlaD